MNGWVAFWIAVAVFIVCEVALTLHGINTVLWQFRTPAELEIQKRLGGIDK